MLACAALLLAACGGTRNPEAEKTAETRTEVRYGEEIALVQVPPKGGLTIDEALRNRRSWRFRVSYGPPRARTGRRRGV